MKVPVVTTYSFDSEVVVKLCDSYEEAVKYLEETAKEEARIDKEEDGWDTEFFHTDEWDLANITNHFPDRDDTTTFTIARLID